MGTRQSDGKTERGKKVTRWCRRAEGEPAARSYTNVQHWKVIATKFAEVSVGPYRQKVTDCLGTPEETENKGGSGKSHKDLLESVFQCLRLALRK